jgi:hypothetical protein
MKLFGGKYKLGNIIASGNYGEVFQGIDIESGALKRPSDSEREMRRESIEISNQFISTSCCIILLVKVEEATYVCILYRKTRHQR